MKDYLSAIDDLMKEPYVDKDHLGCVGASFGGYSVYWLAGHHEKRFKAFIAHDGIFNTTQQYYETEEMWFPNWDLGGTPDRVCVQDRFRPVRQVLLRKGPLRRDQAGYGPGQRPYRLH